MKNFLLPLLATVVLTLATVSIVRSQPQRQVTEPPTLPPHSVYPDRVAAVGLVEPSSENISLSAPIPGVVDRVRVKVGQEVKVGEPLVTLDTRALEAARSERQAELSARKAGVAVAEAKAARARAFQAEAQRTLRFAESLGDSGGLSAEETTRRRSAVETATADVQAAEAEILSAQAAVKVVEAGLASVETDLARSTILAPIQGRILQLRIRPGEYAAAGAATPWLILGNVSPLHVRVDVDENEAWRVKPEAPAMAQVRGNARLSVRLEFVRFEPYVVPKVSLTGSSQERVDTRVLQLIYRVTPTDLPLFVGQQMDVYIGASGLQTARVSP